MPEHVKEVEDIQPTITKVEPIVLGGKDTVLHVDKVDSKDVTDIKPKFEVQPVQRKLVVDEKHSRDLVLDRSKDLLAKSRDLIASLHQNKDSSGVGVSQTITQTTNLYTGKTGNCDLGLGRTFGGNHGFGYGVCDLGTYKPYVTTVRYSGGYIPHYNPQTYVHRVTPCVVPNITTNVPIVPNTVLDQVKPMSKPEPQIELQIE